MADRGKIESSKDDGGRGNPASDPADLKAVAATLSNLPGPVDFAGVLAIADSLPVMIAYLDREQRYLFLNRTLAEWLEQPRPTILGRTMKEVVGEQAYEFRRPMVEAALEGEEQWFIADFDHMTRGKLTVRNPCERKCFTSNDRAPTRMGCRSHAPPLLGAHSWA